MQPQRTRCHKVININGKGTVMKKAVLGIIGTVASLSAATADAAKAVNVDVKQLQEENRLLAEQLRNTQAELEKFKKAPPPPVAKSAVQKEADEPLVETEHEATPAASAGANRKDFMVAVGAKVWLTEWNTWRTPKFQGGSEFTSGSNVSTLTSTSNSEPSVIPSLTARYKDFFFSGSYLSQTDYDFNEQSTITDFLDPTDNINKAITTKYKLSGSRKEWDVTLGYQILPYLAVTAGYKEIQQKFHQNACSFSFGSGSPLSCPSDLLSLSATYAGPTIGISGAAPIGRGFGMYGNFTYGWLGANARLHNVRNDILGNQGEVDDVDYYVGELGFTYTHLLKDLPVYMPLSSATAYAGYRYQTYESEVKGGITNGNKPKDIVQGFVAGFNLAY